MTTEPVVLTAELAKAARRMLGPMSMHANAEEAWKVYEAVEAVATGRTTVAPAGAPLTDSYVQPVPDKCDRIVWRGGYYSLPLAPAAGAGDARAVVAELQKLVAAEKHNQDVAKTEYQEAMAVGAESAYAGAADMLEAALSEQIKADFARAHPNQDAPAAPEAAEGETPIVTWTWLDSQKTRANVELRYAPADPAPAEKAEAVAWLTRDVHGPAVTHLPSVAALWRADHRRVEPLFAAPPDTGEVAALVGLLREAYDYTDHSPTCQSIVYETRKACDCGYPDLDGRLIAALETGK